MRRLCKFWVYLLALSLAWTPFSIRAGLIGTEVVAVGASGEQNREKVLQFVQREEVANQLRALGVPAAAAAERVNALTQEEINQLAGRIDSVPAGAIDTAGWILIALLVGAAIYYLYYK